MSDPPKFNFGTPSSSSSPFANTAKSTGTSRPGLFGTSGGGTGFTGFGNPAGTTTTAGSTSSLFSGAGASSAQNTSAGTASSIPTFSWGGPPASTSAPSSTNATSATPLFGSTTPAAPKIGGFAFGSTTPAGEPPKETALGASTGATAGSNLFGGQKNLFQQPPATATPGSNSTAKPSLFGAQVQGTGQSNNSAGNGQGLITNQSSNAFAGFAPTKSTAPSTAPTTSTTGNGQGFSFTKPQANTTTSSSTSLFAPSTGASPAPGQNGQKPIFGFPAIESTPGAGAEKTSSTEPAAQKAPAFSFPSITPNAASPSAPARGGTVFSGFGIANTTNATSSSTAAASSATTAAPAFSFPSTSTSTSQAAVPATTASAFPSFSPAPASTSSSSQPATTSSAFPSFTVGGASTSAAQPAATSAAAPATTSTTSSSLPAAPAGLTASTSGPVPPSQSRLKNKTMDEILTRWATDLTKYTKDFRSSAETVATWDQHLVDNMSKISKLYSQTLTAERQTESVEMQLSAVENQQAELESWLNVYEKQVEEMLDRENKGQSEVGGPDSERERTYRLSEKLGERLDEMGADLESMVGEINAANASLSRNGKQDEPITQIVRILNSHLTQLKAIDDGAAALNAKVEKAQKALGNLGYSNGGANGNESAADDFYKSYLGRRG